MNDIQIQVKTHFIADQSDPEMKHFVFAYTITITNLGVRSAQLRTRHWIITDSNGKREEVQGEGVVGVKPVIAPGKSYTYTSGAVLKTDVGTMHGSYQMVDEHGYAFDVAIPSFMLCIPRTLH